MEHEGSYVIRKSPPLDTMQNQMYPFHNWTPCFFVTRFNATLPTVLRLLKSSSPIQDFKQKFCMHLLEALNE
jgi:hypothetical protein